MNRRHLVLLFCFILILSAQPAFCALFQLTTESENQRTPSWSPDGQNIVFSQDAENPFFLQSNGCSTSRSTIQGVFERLRDHAGVNLPSGSRWQPRLHDLRHSAAVHRVVSWYREGKDVQALLPHLSVYMGHAHLASTQGYLSMTPDLLREAGVRFAKYAAKELAHG